MAVKLFVFLCSL